MLCWQIEELQDNLNDVKAVYRQQLSELTSRLEAFEGAQKNSIL